MRFCFLQRPQKGKMHLQQLAVTWDVKKKKKKKTLEGAEKTQNEDGDCTWSSFALSVHTDTHSSPLSAEQTSVARRVIEITSVAFSCIEAVAKKGWGDSHWKTQYTTCKHWPTCRVHKCFSETTPTSKTIAAHHVSQCQVRPPSMIHTRAPHKTWRHTWPSW